MRIKGLIVAGILLTVSLLGCGTNSSDSYVEFEIEDETYTVEGPVFVITTMVDGYGFYDLTYRPLGSIPGAGVQWRMKMKPLEEWVGENLDLNTVDPNLLHATVFLRLTEGMTLQSQSNSKVHFKIDRIEAEMIEGSFSATNLKYVSRTMKIPRTEDITARFRVKVVEQDWKDLIRSRKRSSK